MLVKSKPKKFYEYSALGGKAAVVTASFAKGANFNGSTYLKTSTSTGLTTSPGKSYICSFWFKQAVASPGVYGILFENSANDGFALQRTNGQVYYVYGYDTSFIDVATFGITSNPINDTNWHHLLCSADRTVAGFNLVLDGVVLVPGPNYSYAQTSSNNIAFNSPHSLTIGARDGGSLAVQGDLAEMYMAYNQYIDVSVPANIAKFRTLSGHPADVGTNGQTPTGTAPTCYFSIRTGGVAADFKTNRGTGGLTWQDGTAGGVGAGTIGLATVDP